MKHPMTHLAEAASLGLQPLDLATLQFVNVTDTYYYIDAAIGYGTEFLVGQGGASPETYAALYGVVEITGLEAFTDQVIDKTHLRSPGRAREKLVGLSDYENITVRCRYNPAAPHGGHKYTGGDGFSASRNMPSLQKSKRENNFRVLIGYTSPQEEVEFTGVVSGMSRGTITPDGLVERTYTITPLRDYRPDTLGA